MIPKLGPLLLPRDMELFDLVPKPLKFSVDQDSGRLEFAVAKTMPFSEVKTRLPELVLDVEQHEQEIVETRNGKPAAVLVRHLSPDLKRAIKQAFRVLSVDPFAGTPLIGGLSGLWRIRVRRFRIVYEPDRKKRIFGFSSLATALGFTKT